MAGLLDLVVAVLLLAGAVMTLIGALGLIRLPDVFARMHGASIIDTFGVGAIVVGLMFVAGVGIVTVKLVLIGVFILFTSPAATHALARAALNGGVKPEVVPTEDEPGPETAPDPPRPPLQPQSAGDDPSKT